MKTSGLMDGRWTNFGACMRRPVECLRSCMGLEFSTVVVRTFFRFLLSRGQKLGTLLMAYSLLRKRDLCITIISRHTRLGKWGVQDLPIAVKLATVRLQKKHCS